MLEENAGIYLLNSEVLGKVGVASDFLEFVFFTIKLILGPEQYLISR